MFPVFVEDRTKQLTRFFQDLVSWWIQVSKDGSPV